jgi:nicotinamidase-related amidase
VAKTFFQKNYSIVSVAFFALTILVGFFFWQGVTPASAQTIIDEWSKVQAPKPPELKAVTLDQKGTALLVLDFVKQTCNNERRPRCLTSVPQVQALLKLARDKSLLVVHSITTAATPADILKDVAPLEGEPTVKSSADKFLKTDLEKILNDKGIKTVVVVGTAAHGAVLNTASQAAFRGLQVIVPVDGMSAENTYFEQYTAYHLGNAPGVGQQVTLTKIDMIK